MARRQTAVVARLVAGVACWAALASGCTPAPASTAPASPGTSSSGAGSAGGSPSAGSPSAGSSSAGSSSASATPSAVPDLTRPGRAAAAVRELQTAAGNLPIIKVDLTATTAMLSAVDDGKVVAWSWEQGTVSPAESDIEYVKQASFDPSKYALDDLGALFRTAATISGSESNQALQIVDYNSGHVLMTVTTRPESMPVFFRPDGTPINQLDFAKAASFAEALKDVTTTPTVLAVGWSSEAGLWADVPGAEPGVVERTTRQAKVPAWSSSRKADTTGPRFPIADVDPAALASMVVALPSVHQVSAQDVSFTIQRHGRMARPVIEWNLGGQRVVTTLSGTDITKLVP